MESDPESSAANSREASQEDASIPDDHVGDIEVNGAGSQRSLKSEGSMDSTAGAEADDVLGQVPNNGGMLGDGDDESLFGSDAEDELPEKPQARRLDDEDLDSGDDEDRPDRVMKSIEGGYDEEEESGEENARIMDVHIGRHAQPETTNGEIYTMKLPTFLGVEPVDFSPQRFKMPESNHHSTAPAPPDFSPFGVATSTIRWRHSPKDSGQLESDSRILVWSDGSMTLQMANNPTAQFELTAKPLAPVLRKAGAQGAYNAQMDSHTYLTAPHESAQILRVTNHVTTSLTVMPSSQVHDEALTKLQAALAAAKRPSQTNADGSLAMITVSEDPELAKKRAEVAEKDRIKQQKKMQMNMMREMERANRSLGRSGLARGAAGLSVGALEDDDALTPDRVRKQRTGPRKRPTRGRYSDDEDDLPRGRTREDEYDRNDDFLVDSEEEDEDFAEGDDDEEEEVVDEGSEEEQPARAARSPKRDRPKKTAQEKVDAAAQGSRGKRRRVIDEDEDE